MPDATLLSGGEWAKHWDVIIHDPDGWRASAPWGYCSLSDLITEREFWERACVSTCSIAEKGAKRLKKVLGLDDKLVPQKASEKVRERVKLSEDGDRLFAGGMKKVLKGTEAAELGKGLLAAAGHHPELTKEEALQAVLAFNKKYPDFLKVVEKLADAAERKHVYLSTACWHGTQANDDSLHAHCSGDRNLEGEVKEPKTCKWCSSKCICECHT